MVKLNHVQYLKTHKKLIFCFVSKLSVSYLDGASTEESDYDGDNVDGQLELEELGDAVVDIATPHDCLDDARKVVVRQDDVGRFFGDVRPSDALTRKETRRCFERIKGCRKDVRRKSAVKKAVITAINFTPTP